MSGCQICATTGQCNAAFHSGPGHYCGSFYDVSVSGNKPCCCPLQAVCKVSTTQCTCHVPGNRPPPVNPYPSPHSDTYPTPRYEQYETSPLGPMSPLIFILLCFCCCAWCFCRQRDETSEEMPVATAVPASYCPPENPAFNAINYGSAVGGDGGAGNAIASGIGGFAVGTIIGDLIGRTTGGGGGGGYNVVGDAGGAYNAGGGYDIAGDTGGNGGGGYDIAGDTGGNGGGGFDIAGDSGGDGGGFDFAGDS